MCVCGVGGWGLLEPGAGVWKHGWSTGPGPWGETSERAGGP